MGKRTIVLNNAKNQQKYYAVHCKCGHVGPNSYIEIVFAVVANSGREAAAKARQFARVKHHKKNAIIACYEISHAEHDRICETNKNDPYLRCKNIQEQRLIEGLESRITKEQEKVAPKKNKKERKSFIKYKLKKQKQLIDALTSANIYDYSIEKGNMLYENTY